MVLLPVVPYYYARPRGLLASLRLLPRGTSMRSLPGGGDGARHSAARSGPKSFSRRPEGIPGAPQILGVDSAPGISSSTRRKARRDLVFSPDRSSAPGSSPLPRDRRGARAPFPRKDRGRATDPVRDGEARWGSRSRQAP